MSSTCASRRRFLERGEISEMIIVVLIGVFLIIGLVVDGGAKLTASAQAASIAQEAGRAGAQQIQSLPGDGQPAEIDPELAAEAAEDYLDQAGTPGSVTVLDDQTIQVTVTVSQPTIFLSLIGIGSLSSTRTAETDLIQGQDEVTP